MKIRKIYFLPILLASFSLFGWSCTPQGEGFIKKDFHNYNRIAILPFNCQNSEEITDLFSLYFSQAFPQVSIVERSRLREIFREQDFDPWSLDPSTRARIGKVLGVQALVLGRGGQYLHCYPAISTLTIRIVDTETGVVIGQSAISNNQCGAMTIKSNQGMCRQAVKALR